jgi:hypothetical protein
MEIRFQTKEESKHQQEEEFLKLSGEERIMRFLQLSRRINRLMPVNDRMSFEDRNKGNFLLIHKDLEDDEVGRKH